MSDPITFSCAVYSVRTLADGGLRISLDLSEGDIDAVTWLMQMKRNNTPLRVACVADNDDRANREKQKPKAVK